MGVVGLIFGIIGCSLSGLFIILGSIISISKEYTYYTLFTQISIATIISGIGMVILAITFIIFGVLLFVKLPLTLELRWLLES